MAVSKIRYAMLVGLLASGMAHSFVVRAETQQAAVYDCKSGHIADVFGDGGESNLFVSVDHKAALPLIGDFTLPPADEKGYPVVMLVFGEKAAKERVVLAQGVQRTMPNGDHGLSVSYIDKSGKEVFTDHNCYGEEK